MGSNPFLANSANTLMALVPQQNAFPAASLTERTYLESLVEEPSSKSLFGVIENVRRDYRARKAETSFLDKVREQVLSYTQARLEVELQGELAQMVEGLRHAMTMVQLQNYAIEQEYAAQRTMQMRLSAAREFQEFGRRLVEIGYPEEQVDRALTNAVNNMLSVAGAQIATMEGIDAFAAAARTQSASGQRLGERDAIVHSEPR